jgi:SHS2 domain-containing protein
MYWSAESTLEALLIDKDELRPSPAHWEHFPHGADIGIRGFGSSPEIAFEQAALAMIAVITDPAVIRLERTVEITAEAANLDFLFFDWLNSLVFEMAEQRLVFGAFDVAITGRRLSGRAIGEPVAPERHMLAVEIKGATFTELAVIEDRAGEWRAQCVVDV